MRNIVVGTRVLDTLRTDCHNRVRVRALVAQALRKIHNPQNDGQSRKIECWNIAGLYTAYFYECDLIFITYCAHKHGAYVNRLILAINNNDDFDPDGGGASSLVLLERRIKYYISVNVIDIGVSACSLVIALERARVFYMAAVGNHTNPYLLSLPFRVCPESFRLDMLARELSLHQSDAAQGDEVDGGAVEVFMGLGQLSIAVDLSDGAFYDLAFGQGLDALLFHGRLDDLFFPGSAGDNLLQLGAAIGTTVGNLSQPGKEPVHVIVARHRGAILILHRGRIDHGGKLESEATNQVVALLTLDAFACIIVWRFDGGAQFFTFLTLWLLIALTVGLASRPARCQVFR